MSEQDIHAALESIYGGSPEYAAWAINRYKDFYDLPTIENVEEVPARLFQLYQRGQYFVVVVTCNHAGEILITKDITQAQTEWQLPGGFIKDGETIEDACDRIVRSHTGQCIDGIEPLAVVRNEFRCQNRAFSHDGLAFIAYTQGALMLPANRLGAYIVQPTEQLAYSNQKIAAAAISRITQKESELPEDEIDISRHYAFRRWIHGLVVRRIFEVFSSRPLRRKIKQLCGQAETIIDVACGDDRLILELARTAKFCVANDVSWNTLKQLRRMSNCNNVFFTNHDAIDLPFRRRFDVVICKNVLHHMHNPSELRALFASLARAGEKVILIDIENPRKSSRLAGLWHSYYVSFLGDRGRYFLTRSEFAKIVSLVYADAQISYDLVQTIKGNYMFAVIQNPVQHEADAPA